MRYSKKQLRQQKRDTRKTAKTTVPKNPTESSAIKSAKKANSYNDKIRAYAKKHRCTITQATIALMK